MKYADLHIHTSFSDSTFTPKEVLERSRENGLGCIAICDHDTLQGFLQAWRLSKEYDIEVIPSVEMTCGWESREIHILGYLLDYKDERFLGILNDIRKQRRQRIYSITQRLKRLGFDLEPREVFSQVPQEEASVGRLHVAQALVMKGLVPSYKEAFSRLLGDNKPAYVSRFRFNPYETLSILRQAKAIPVLAHPLKSGCDDLIPSLVEAGLLGIEVFYPHSSPRSIEFYKHLAGKHNLLMTGGSDCHGKAKREILIGKIKVPYSLVEQMKQRHREIYG